MSETNGKRVLVCGGRDYRDADRVFMELEYLDSAFGVAAIIHGGASGADSLAAKWAVMRRVPAEAFFAFWERDGKAAGPIRNARMLNDGKPDMVLAFPGGRGTDDMVRKAMAAGVPVVQIPHTPQSAVPSSSPSTRSG